MEVIDNAKLDLSKIPFDEKHKLLAIKSIKAIFDSIEYTEFMLGNGRIITACSTKANLRNRCKVGNPKLFSFG